MPSRQVRVRVNTVARSIGPAALLLSLGAGSCGSLFSGFSTDNPDNCVRNTELCQAPAQACNPLTKLCEPAVMLTDVQPPGGTNLGGEMVTLTGDHFVAGMAVMIDGEPATAVTVSGAQQLTAITPPRPGRQGPVAIELVHPEGQRLQRDKLFRYYGEVSLQQMCFQGPSGPRIVVAADFNGDRKTDLVVAGFSQVRTYLSSGDGFTFQSPMTITPGGIPQNLATADVNGDGKLDLVISNNSASSSIATALGNGDGTFAALLKTTVTSTAYGLALGDVTGDGRLDALSLQGKDLVIQAGAGDGTFLAEKHIPFAIQNAGGSAGITLADLDKDGRLDVIAANTAEQDISILFGESTGFGPANLIPLPSQPSLVVVGDYDQDGVTDVLVGLTRTARKVELMQGLGGRSFGPLPSLALPINTRFEAQADAVRN